MAEQTGVGLQLVLQQLHDDESLTADLTDPSAEAVFTWLEDELRAADSLDDRQLAVRAAQLRRAVKQAARRHADDPAALIQQAKDIIASADPPHAAHESDPHVDRSQLVPPEDVVVAADHGGQHEPERSRRRAVIGSRGPGGRRRRGWAR